MRLVTAVLVAVLTLVGGGAVAGCGGGGAKGPPTLAGELVGGGTYDPAAHRGKVTVVNFWGSWCAPCRDEMPELIAAFDALRPDGVAFLGINVRDPNVDLARSFVERFKVPFPSLRDPAGKLAPLFDLPPSTIPATLILAPDGTVAREYRKPLRRDEVVAAVREVAADG